MDYNQYLEYIPNKFIDFYLQTEVKIRDILFKKDNPRETRFKEIEDYYILQLNDLNILVFNIDKKIIEDKIDEVNSQNLFFLRQVISKSIEKRLRASFDSAFNTVNQMEH